MKNNNMKKFKPNLIPNNKTDGSKIDWNSRIKDPLKWRVSEKYDGIRVEINFNKDGECTIFTRSLKRFRSTWIKDLESKLHGAIKKDIWIEGEIYCSDMMFNEIQHFFLSEDVSKISSVNKTLREMKSGKFEGRTIEWLSTYDHNFVVMLFDCFLPDKPDMLFWNRQHFLRMAYLDMNSKAWNKFALITQLSMDNVEGIKNFYNEIIKNKGEGIILKHEDQIYKFGRDTLKACTSFKMIDEFNLYNGTIIDILEGTIVDPMIETSTNELGRSVTSKLKSDRWPSGKAKGFEVVLSDGKKLTVTLKGFNDANKAELLRKKAKWVGKEIEFLGKPPTKTNGVPRQAKYINN